MQTVAEKRAAFRALHDEGCFVIPNPWDAGSARMLEHLGFLALATSSAGFAWTLGRPDGGVTVDDVLAHLTTVCAATNLPVNADFESGFAEDVTENVGRAIATGIAGLSIEDRVVGAPSQLYDRKVAAGRIRTARALVGDVMLIARTERLLIDPSEVSAAIDSLVEFAAAGADVLFAPGVEKPDDIRAMVRAVAPKPLNLLVMRPGPNLAALAELGVRRISIGGGLARIAWTAAMSVADQLVAGSFDGLVGAPSRNLNAMFS
jgi:2-methylisocitrate lyase-like PEP mutase family enzyme